MPLLWTRGPGTPEGVVVTMKGLARVFTPGPASPCSLGVLSKERARAGLQLSDPGCLFPANRGRPAGDGADGFQ